MSEDTTFDQEPTPKDSVISFLKFVTVATLPWLYISLERASVLEGEYGDLDLRRVLWSVPLFYGFGAVAVVVLSVQRFSLAAVMDLVESSSFAVDVFLYHVLIPLGLLTGVISVGAFRGVLVLGMAVAVVVAGRQFKQVSDAHRVSSVVKSAGEDRYLLPVKSVKRREGIGSSYIPMKRNQSMLVLGQPGVGKTESIKILAYQMAANPDEPFVVFDYKDEYQGLFDSERVITLSLNGGTVSWNIFREVDNEHEFTEIAKRFFPDDSEKAGGDNAIFAGAARDVFAAILKHQYRRLENPDNTDLAAFVDKSYKDVVESFERAGHHDLANDVRDYIDPDASKQALGVYMFLKQTVNEVFTQEFAVEGGQFSIREYMRDPDGKVLILDMPSRGSETVLPAFRFFLDWAIQYALEDASKGSYFILDEFARVPGLKNIEDLTGAGRSRRAQAILGLQGISQLKSNYEENYADDILAGVTQEILMRTGDTKSTEYVLDRLGETYYTTRTEKPKKWYESKIGGNTQERVEKVHPIPSAEIQRFDKGEAVVMTEDGWTRVQLPMWSDLPAGVRSGLRGEETAFRLNEEANDEASSREVREEGEGTDSSEDETAQSSPGTDQYRDDGDVSEQSSSNGWTSDQNDFQAKRKERDEETRRSYRRDAEEGEDLSNSENDSRSERNANQDASSSGGSGTRCPECGTEFDRQNLQFCPGAQCKADLRHMNSATQDGEGI